MFTRHCLAIAVVFAGLTMGLATLHADEGEPTASQLYEQGMKLYQEGDWDAARDVFHLVDPMQLSKDDRLSYYEAIRSTDQPTASKTQTADDLVAPAEQAEQPQPRIAGVPQDLHPTMLMRLADQAMSDNPSKAAALYRMVLKDTRTDEVTQGQAQARIAQANRLAQPALTASREHLDLATDAVLASRFNVARAFVQAVKDSGTVLGWRDQARLERLTATIEENTPKLSEPAQKTQEQEPKTQAPRQEELINIAPVQTVAAAQDVTAPDQAQTVDQAPSGDLLRQVQLAYAQQKSDEAQQAQADGQLRLAIELYKQAAELDPENQKIKKQLGQAIALQNKALAPQGLIPEILGREQVKAQEVQAQFKESMNQARKHTDERRFSAAFDAVADAKVVLDRNQRFLAPQAYRQLRSEAETLAGDIESKRADAQAQAIQDEEALRLGKEQRARRKANQEKNEEIQRLLRRALDMQRDMKYAQALDLLDQALFLNPNDVAVHALKEMLEETKILVEAREATRTRNLLAAQQRVMNIEASTPYSALITYPADWPHITHVRLSNLDVSGGESEADRQVALKLRESVPINFEANRLANVIDFLRNTTGANFFVNWTVLEAAGVDQDTLITLTLDNVPAEQALRLVLQQIGSEFDPITFSIIEGVVNISTERDLSKTTDTRVYDIRDLLVQVPNFTDAPSFDLTEALSNTSSGGGGSGGGGGSSIFGDSDDEDDENQPTREELIEDITSLITETVGSFEEWSINGGDVSSLDELNGNLIVKTTPKNHRNIVGLLAQLREIRSGQISVETRFLLVDESFLEEFGFDLDFNIKNLGSNIGSFGIAQDTLNIVESGTRNSRGFGLPNPSLPGVGPGVFLPGFGFDGPSGLFSNKRSLDLGVSFLGDLEVNLLINATQANRRSLTLTAPRITLFNGQRSYVIVATQRAFVSDLEPIPDTIGFDVTLSVAQEGVVLDVEGTISADRRYVTLTLRPSLAIIKAIVPFDVGGTITIQVDDDNDPDTDPVDQIISFGGSIGLPEIEITSVRTTVSIPDQGTLLIGGQRIVGEIEVESGVPILSKIPILQRFFTSNSMTKDQRTLLILVKPSIILQSEIEEDQFPGLLQDPGAFNISNRIR